MRSTKKYSKRKPYGRTKKNRRVRRYRGGADDAKKEPIEVEVKMPDKSTQKFLVTPKGKVLPAGTAAQTEEVASTPAQTEEVAKVGPLQRNGEYGGGRRRKSAHRRRKH